MPTGDVSDPVVMQEAREWRAALHARGRIGRFVDMPDGTRRRQVRTAAPASPGGAYYTIDQIREAGLDRMPTKDKAAQELLGDAATTAEIHALGAPASPGELKIIPYDERATKEHDRIVAAAFKGKTPSPSRPHALFSAGGTASGKSTLFEANPELLPPEEHTIHINTDLIQNDMGDYQKLTGAGSHYAVTAVHDEAGDIATRMLFEAMEGGFDVVVEGTGNGGPGAFARVLTAVHDRGYSVDVVYVNTPTDVAILQAITRAEKGQDAESGRYVPVPKIREIHAKVSRNFESDVLPLRWLNSLEVFDAGEHIATLVDGEVRPFGDTEEEFRSNTAKLEAFIAKGNEWDDGE